MINKNVCPKCGQLYDQNMDRCPLCGAPAPKPDYEPIRRQRITEEERRRRRAEQRQTEKEMRRKEREERRRRIAEEEAYLEAEEARERDERRGRRPVQEAPVRQSAPPVRQQPAAPKQPAPAARPAAPKQPAPAARPQRPAPAQTPQPQLQKQSAPKQPQKQEPDLRLPQTPKQSEEPKAMPKPAEREKTKSTPRPAAIEEPKPTPLPKAEPRPAEPENRSLEVMDEEADEAAARRVPAAYYIVSTVILALALLLGGSYLLWSHGILGNPLYDALSGKPAATEPVQTTPVTTTVPITTATESLDCIGIVLGDEELVLTEAESEITPRFSLVPENTPDPVSFEIGNENIATVSETGAVTLAGPGKTTLRILCGDQVAEIPVSCIVPLTVNKDDMTFFNAGESFQLKVEDLYEGADLVFTTDDPEVAAVSETGLITAVGSGTCTIIVSVGDAKGEAIVRCNFD